MYFALKEDTVTFINVWPWDAICMAGKEVPTVSAYERKHPCAGRSEITSDCDVQSINT